MRDGNKFDQDFYEGAYEDGQEVAAIRIIRLLNREINKVDKSVMVGDLQDLIEKVRSHFYR